MKIEKNFDELTAIELYFLYLDEDKFLDCMEDFSNKIGYSISEFISCAFPSEYESWEEGYFGEIGIKFEIEPPAVDEKKYEIVSNTDFIDFLEELTQQYLDSYPMEKFKIELLLKKIKNVLLKK